jgi:ATP-dependent RNA helicase SUPV3L1/SUV3
VALRAKTDGPNPISGENTRLQISIQPIPEPTVTSTSTAKNNDIAHLDSLTGGAFTAPTSGERSARVRDWLLTSPSAEQLADVFKELSIKDKGAAKLVREKIDEAKRAKGQEALAADWANKAQGLLDMVKLNIADALAWQRDAAKAGAPLSREPLAALKTLLADRVRVIEDLQRRVQVQREAAVLLAQRIEVLSTKSWKDAQAALDALRVDVEQWQSQATQLVADASWASVDAKFPPLLDASRGQLLVVWDAFQGALALAVTAAQDAAAPLPPVPMWANELRTARGVPMEAPAKQAKPKIDPEVRAKATASVREVLTTLESEIAEGHGKASAGAANGLRHALKEFGRLIDDKLENQAHAALAAAGEMEGWQRWRADQLREALVAQAEGLLKRPEGQTVGGRKMQETLRSLREHWKQTDQGGAPNHAMWKRFDEACNEAHKVVEAWLDKVRAESAEHKAQRLALIEEVNAWATANRTALDDDWKGFNRILYQFGDRWREAGHLGEKAFAELQPLWKAAISNAAAPLEALQAESLALRHAMIDDAKILGAAPELRIDAVKALQQRWQAQAHRVPMDRRQEQKLWDAFRKPIDDAFNRKTVDREKAEASLGARDRMVLQAAKALDAANATGDAQVIRAAMAALEAALQGQALAQAEVHTAGAQESEAKEAVQSTGVEENTAPALVEPAQVATETVASSDATEDAPVAEAPAAEAAPAPKPAPKPVIAMRGDDRPGMKKEAPTLAGARGAGKWGDRKDSNSRGPRDSKSGPRSDDRSGPPRGDSRSGGHFGSDSRSGGYDSRPETPRLGDAAFRAQRDALEQAQYALKKLAVQAHGEALTQLLTAWEKRDPNLVPGAQDLGNRAPPAVRNAWVQALGDVSAVRAKAADPHVALLRLEMAAEVPTPAEDLDARRSLQLQLLTRRNDPPPAQTWGQDTAAILASPFNPQAARRVQNVLKVLLKK